MCCNVFVTLFTSAWNAIKYSNTPVGFPAAPEFGPPAGSNEEKKALAPAPKSKLYPES